MKLFLVIFSLGFILRLFLIIWSFNFPQNPDLLRHRDWGRISFLRGLDKTYEAKYLTYGEKPNNLPPGATYFISSAYYLSIQVSKLLLKLFSLREASLIFLNIYIVDLFLKLPAVFCDLLIAGVIYLTVKKIGSRKYALISSSIFLFNPVILYNSAVWGQIDAVNCAFFLLSLSFLLQKKIFLSIFFCLFSFYIKLSLLPFLPLYLFLLFSSNIKSTAIAKNFFFGIIFLFLFTFVFFPEIENWFNYFFYNNLKTEENLLTVNAFNFWYILLPFFYRPGLFPSSSLFLSAFSFFLFFLFLLPVFVKILNAKFKINAEKIFLLCSLYAVLIFLFFPRMHERYLYPFFVFMPMFVALNKKYLKIYLILTALNFYNLFVVWHPMVSGEIVEILKNPTTYQLVSLLTVVTGLYFYRRILQIEIKN